MRPSVAALLLLFAGLAGCTDGIDNPVISVGLGIENQSDAVASLRLYAVDPGAGPDGQDVWLPARVERQLGPGESYREDELLVVDADLLQTLRFWTQVVDPTFRTQETYTAVSSNCQDALTWEVHAVYDGATHVTISCDEA